ncbi:YIP1 family protein [Alkalihalobacillus sp. TS-13]|uniref:YIP1 family protein n=1 Tax=Alkalihalobacillus sp. TS-13 TaxID=2842455 RepID=UPI001C8884B1|nr:YIP1 family protein [Alkalihalobacillus sp. TS-13]
MARLKIILLLTVAVVLLGTSTASAEAPFITYTFDKDGYPIYTQTAYQPIGTIDGFDIQSNESDPLTGESDPLFQPEDIFIDKNDTIYVADTGNSRVVVFDSFGNFQRIVGEDVLSKPTGVFVDDKGFIYVADYQKKKVFKFQKDGSLAFEYEKPDSVIYGKKSPFNPTKVIIDKQKNVYIVGDGSTQGLIQLGPEGDFLGYYGGNRTSFDLVHQMQKMLYTEKQYSQLMKKYPPSATNVAVDDEGLIYTSTAGLKTETIKKLNVAGENLLPDVSASNNIADITVDQNKNIFAVDSKYGYIFEYDPDGNLLFVFGGLNTGHQRLGLFKTPSGIAVSSDRKLFILDKKQSNIQILKPTEFTSLIHNAIALNSDGKYLESEHYWNEVLKRNSMFSLAHNGIGKAAFKKGNYEKALEEFRLAGNDESLSEAYWEIRRNWLMKYVSWVLIGIVLLALSIFLVKRLYRRNGYGSKVVDLWIKFKNIEIVSHLLHVFRILRHPVDGYYELRTNQRASVFSATLLLLFLFIVHIFTIFETNALFSDVDTNRVNITTELYKVYLPLFAWVICNYLISTINDGIGKFKNVYIGTVYALSPYLIFSIPITLMSKGLTNMEVVLYDFSKKAIILWSAFLLFMMVKEIHSYEIGQTIKNMVLSVAGMLVLGIISFILFGLSNQVIDFMYSIFQEVKLRV